MGKLTEYLVGVIRAAELPEHKNEALPYMQKNGVYFFNVHDEGGVTAFTVPAKYAKDEGLMKLCRTERQRGLLYDLKKLLRRPGLIAGAVIFAAALSASRMILWDVRYEPGGGEDTAGVMKLARENGLYSGAPRAGIDRRRIENLILLGCPDVGYVRINVTGTVAVVVTDSRMMVPAPEKRKSPDLCASEDGYVIRYETYAGRAVVERGQTVKRGDVLISGTYETHHHGTVTTAAEGKVYALVCRTFLCETDATVPEKNYTGKTYVERALTLFSRSIGGKKEHEGCEKETAESELTVFRTVTLPVKLQTSTYREYTISYREVDEDEANGKLTAMYDERISKLKEEGKIEKIAKKTYKEGGKYKLYCEVWLVCNIAE